MPKRKTPAKKPTPKAKAKTTINDPLAAFGGLNVWQSQKPK